MACAAFAAEAGARTLMVEKQGETRGSSNISAGMLYVLYCTPTLHQLADNMMIQLARTYDKLRSCVVPDGDPALQRAWLDAYLPAVQWMRENGMVYPLRSDLRAL
jgi:hypothetical protein